MKYASFLMVINIYARFMEYKLLVRWIGRELAHMSTCLVKCRGLASGDGVRWSVRRPRRRWRWWHGRRRRGRWWRWRGRLGCGRLRCGRGRGRGWRGRGRLGRGRFRRGWLGRRRLGRRWRGRGRRRREPAADHTDDAPLVAADDAERQVGALLSHTPERAAEHLRETAQQALDDAIQLLRGRRRRHRQKRHRVAVTAVSGNSSTRHGGGSGRDVDDADQHDKEKHEEGAAAGASTAGHRRGHGRVSELD
ncbi:uncharacterized protein LOC100382391 [Zea mays]|jgi:hypothetical protein|uniref:Uncharacterized protein n=1 Tax=Zea mays TaxID=4577 RepID=C0P776_MAIZE|nr:uncharacterized protein LOC100382391 [Zea mays]ACN28842.1 unknown [Zea mays]|eukprot:NP_001168607.1 uncharacterized protein LOC100382391 [Zea mays]